jgi:hypothetical protein
MLRDKILPHPVRFRQWQPLKRTHQAFASIGSVLTMI